MAIKLVLNNKEIEKLTFAEKEYEVIDSEYSFLYLRVSKKTKTFRFIKKDKYGNLHRITIGSYPAVKRLNAIKTCFEYIEKINNGISPMGEIRTKKNEFTLGEALEFYLLKRSRKLCDKVYNDYKNDIPRIFSKFMNRKLSLITDDEVENIFEDLTENNGPSAANHAIEKLKAVINFCIKKHKYNGENPCTPIEMNPKGSRDRFLTESEYPIFLQAVEQEDIIMRSIFKTLLFTGVRKTNTLEMKWSQINFDNNIWTIDKTKNGDPLTVYLCDQAVEVLKAIPRIEGCDWVFVNPQTGNHIVDIKKAWGRIKERCGIKDIVIHDLRRSFATVLLSSGVEPSVVAKILGHKSLLATNVYAKLLDYTKNNAVQQAVNNIDKMANHTKDVVSMPLSMNSAFQMSYNISINA